MKKRQTTLTTYNSDKNETGQFLSKEITLDSLDRVIDVTEFNEKGDIIRRLTYRYFESGDLKEEIEYDSNNQLLQRQEFCQNEEGEFVRSIIEYGDGSKIVKDYLFSDLGNADRCYIKDENDQIVGGEVFIFDDNQNVICEIEVDENKNEVFKTERKFSESGNIVEESRYIDGELEYVNLFTYNTKGLIVERIKKDFDGMEIEKEITEYNEQNEEARKVLYANESEIIEEFLYDPNGNSVLNTVHRDGQLVFRVSCSYNEQNELLSEEILELGWDGSINRHEMLRHEYI